MEKNWTGERLETFVFNDTTIEHLHRYALATELVAGKKVLDIACGEGYGSNLLAQKAFEVYGVDIDHETIIQATKKYKCGNLFFKQGSVENIPFKVGFFDMVVSFETLEHIAEHAKMLSEIKRVLKPNGILVISTPEKKIYSDIPKYQNPFHKKELYENEFGTLLNDHFNYHTFFYQNIFSTSFLTNDITGKWNLYEGNYAQINTVHKILPKYILAICCDGEIPKLASSAFLAEGTMETAIEQKEAEVKGTLSYKIGHFILFPVKFIKNIFIKKD